MYDENRDINSCVNCMGMLDTYIDGELSAEDRKFIESHAEHCESCAKELRLAIAVRDYAKGLDDNITVPLSAQSAWRRCVRAEIAGRKRRRFIKTASGIAAAFILMVGCTFALRNTSLLDYPSGAGNIEYLAFAIDELQLAGDSYATADMGMKTRSAVMPTLMGSLQADGETGELSESSDVDEMATVGESALMDVEAAVLVRTATRTAQTTMFDRDRQAMADLVAEYGGFITSANVDSSSAMRVGQYKIRVPDGYLDDFLLAFENVGKTLSTMLTSEDVNAYYYDANSRLNTAKKMVERLNELIPQAEVNSIADLKARLDAAYDEIDELERVIAAYDTDMSYARVYLSLYEVANLPLATPEPSLGERSSSGFNQSLNAIGDFFGDMVVSMAVIAPVAGSILLGVAIVFCIAYYIGKKKSKQTDNSEKKE